MFEQYTQRSSFLRTNPDFPQSNFWGKSNHQRWHQWCWQQIQPNQLRPNSKWMQTQIDFASFVSSQFYVSKSLGSPIDSKLIVHIQWKRQCIGNWNSSGNVKISKRLNRKICLGNVEPTWRRDSFWETEYMYEVFGNLYCSNTTSTKKWRHFIHSKWTHFLVILKHKFSHMSTQIQDEFLETSNLWITIRYLSHWPQPMSNTKACKY